MRRLAGPPISFEVTLVPDPRKEDPTGWVYSRVIDQVTIKTKRHQIPVFHVRRASTEKVWHRP